MSMESIGLIGVGLLGSALARRLVDSGFALTGYDPDAAAMDRLSALGGTQAQSPEQVAQLCRRIVMSLPGPVEVLEVVGRMERHLRASAIVMDTTTGDPALVDAIAQRLAARGAAYLDCEVGGSSKQAAAGEAILICGGETRAFEDCRDLLQSISTCIFHMGPAGTGTRMKLALNICIGLHRAVLAESLEFARANGIDPSVALGVLKAGPAYSRAMDVKGRKMIERDFTPEARLVQHLKDVRLILRTGAAAGARLPLSTVHAKLLSRAAGLGWGGLDNSAVIRMFEADTPDEECDGQDL
jgi:3-hydroxyisobutyrate dehydrogenase-like beta-hydroxyacid dehydrogenase